MRAGVTSGTRLDKVRKKEILFMHAEEFKLAMVLNVSCFHFHPALVQVVRQCPPSPLLQELSSGRVLISGLFHKS